MDLNPQKTSTQGSNSSLHSSKNIDGEIELPGSLQLLRRFNFPKKLGVLERLFGKSLASRGQQWVECWNGNYWKLDLADPCQRWIVFGEYEGGQGIRLAQNILQHGGVYIDSGANIGQWLVYLGGMAQVKSLAFEPVTSQRERLNQCLQQQHNWDVKVLGYGLGASESSLEIQCDGPRSTLHLEWYRHKDFPRETIQIRALDQVLQEEYIKEVTFWKLDVEGAELQALQGAQESLRNHAISNIYVECHPDNYRQVSALLKSFGYALFNLDKGKIVPFLDKNIDSVRDLIAMP